MRRYLWIVVVLIAFSSPARAQDSAAPALEEYDHVPQGLLMPKDGATPAVVEENTDNTVEVGTSMSIDDLTAAYHLGKFDTVADHIMPLVNTGNHKAEELLGIMYHNGEGKPKNPQEALVWLTKAAEANLPLAQHHLAIMAFSGEGMAADPVKALMWLYIAIVHYPEGAEKTRAQQDRDNLASQMNRQDKARAAEMARAWLSKYDEDKLLDVPQ